jgi:hypothetical protein
MKTSVKFILGYIIALAITIFLAIIDSDPITNTKSLVIDVLFMSLIIWGLGLFTFGIKMIVFGTKK